VRHTLIDERTQWLQRIQATLFHHGIGGTPERLRTAEGRDFAARLPLPVDARERIEIALAMIDASETQLSPLERELRRHRRHRCASLRSALSRRHAHSPGLTAVALGALRSGARGLPGQQPRPRRL
jgi:hypothetical protein